MPKRRLDQEKPSLTAEMTAASRHAASREKDPALRLDDPHAYRFMSWRTRLIFNYLRWLAIPIYNRIVPGAYEYILTRTRHLDAMLVRQLAEGAGQILLLGAGYDSRALRFAGPIRSAGAQVVEIDHPATQQRKRSLLNDPPGHLRFHAADFNAEPLGSIFQQAGLDPCLKTYVIWEGVAIYLEPANVDNAIRSMRAFFKSGLTLSLDIVLPEMLTGDCGHLHGGIETARYVSRRGEPLRWGMSPEEVGPYFNARGFQLTRLLDAGQLHREYLGEAGDRAGYRVAGFMMIADVKAR